MKLCEECIDLKNDSNYVAGFGCSAKWVGNFLDEIIGEMEDKHIRVLPELLELKQYLRFKGNSRIEAGDKSLWEEGVLRAPDRPPKMCCMRCHDTLELLAKADELTKFECHCRTVCLNMAKFSTLKEFSAFLKEHDMKVVK